MSGKIAIAPSILSADFLNLERDVCRLTESDEPPEWLHVDVMDGHFVPNLTIGPVFVKALKRLTEVPLDVHLMISNPDEQLDSYLSAGADLVTFHIEAMRKGARGERAGSSATLKELTREEMDRTYVMLERIHCARARAGLSLNPGTPVGLLRPFYHELDLVLVMSVHPGFGGQSFISESLVRIKKVRGAIDRLNPEVLLEVDGGIDKDIAQVVAEMGADILVAGKAIYGQPDPVVAMQAIRRGVAQE